MTRARSPIPMVGRVEELGILRAAYAEGRRGRPRVVLVRGEAGMGKTRLVHEFTASLSPDDSPPAVVATGQCVHLGTIGTPFLPVRRLLRSLRSRVGAESFDRSAQAPGRLTALGAVLPELTEDVEAAPASPDLLADAIEQLLVGLAADRHLILVIEDLQWADASTLDLLRTLAITDEGSHLTIICTHRTHDVAAGDPASAFIGELARSPSATTIDLAALPVEETTELIRMLAPELDPAAVAHVAARSEGVPFFVEELVDVGSGALPTTLRDIVLARVARLSAEGQDVVGCLSAGGDRVLHDVFEDVHPTDPAAGLREAIASQVIVARGDAYRFRHALIQELVYNELMPGDRARLHSRYANAFQTHVDAGTARLATAAAEHWLRAGDLPRAFDASVIARRHAADSKAMSVAIELGERLLDLWDQVPDAAARAGMSHADLATSVMADSNALAAPLDVIRIGEQSLATIADDDPVGRARIHRFIGVAHSNSNRPSDAIRALATARALLEPESGRARDATLALVQSMELGLDPPRPRDKIHAAATACLTLAERSCTRVELDGVRTNVAGALADYGFFDEAVELLRLAVEESPLFGVLSRSMLAYALSMLGRFDDAVQTCEEGLLLAGEFGIRSDSGLIGSYFTGLASARSATGDPVRARAALALAALDERSPEFGNARASAAAAMDAWEHGSAAAPESLPPRPDPGEDPFRRIVESALSAEIALNHAPSSGHPGTDLDTALRALAELTDPSLAMRAGMLRRAVPVLARTLRAASATQADLGRLRRVLDGAIHGLAEDAGAAALRALAGAEELDSAPDDDAAVAGWRAAVDAGASGCIHVRYRRYAEFRLALALERSGDRDGSGRILRELIETAPADGVGIVAEWARDAAARRGIPLPRASAPVRAAARPGLENLTPREREVLSLVAQGLSNSEIGRRLFISPKTASVHVSAILAKVGAANRAEAAAVYAAAGNAADATAG